MINDVLQGSGPCLVERIDLSENVLYYDLATLQQQQRVVGFVVPSQQLVELYQPVVSNNCILSNGYCWVENARGPIFDQRSGNDPYIRLKYNNKTASVDVMPYTGKLEVTYN